MVDAGNTGKAGNIGPKPNIGKPSKKIEFKPADDNKQIQQQKAETTSKQNKTVFKSPSPSSEKIVSDQANKDSVQKQKTENKNATNLQEGSQKETSGLKKHQKVVKNPKVAAFLKKGAGENLNKKPVNGKSNKQKPPPMSYRTLYAPKYPLNPRRIKPDIPKRLQSNNPADSLKILQEALNFDPSKDQNLIAQYTKKLIAQGKESGSNEILTFAQLIGVNESIAQLKESEIRKTLISKLLELEVSSEELALIIDDLIGQLNNPETPILKPLIQFFFPLPFPYIIFDLDESFYEDEKELLEEEFGDEEEEEENNEEEEAEKELKAKTEASMSINTINYGKLHLHLVYDSKDSQMKLSVKGDERVMDLSIALESNIEDAIDQNTLFLQDELRLWHDNVLRITESRSIKIDSKGTLNPMFLKACNSLLETICVNDQEIDTGEIEGDYKVL